MSNDKEQKRKQSVRMLVITLCLILIVFILFVILLPTKNRGLGTGSEANGWFESVPVNIFDENVAPGTQGEHDITIKNTSNYPMEYELAFYSTEGYVPLKYRVLNDGEYIIGNESEWVDVATFENAVKTRGSVSVGGLLNLTVEWCWPFESGNDALDTQLGINNTKEKFYITVSGLDRGTNAPVVMKPYEVELIGPGITALTIFVAFILGKGYYTYDRMNRAQQRGSDSK